MCRFEAELAICSPVIQDLVGVVVGVVVGCSGLANGEIVVQVGSRGVLWLMNWWASGGSSGVSSSGVSWWMKWWGNGGVSGVSGD